MYSWIWSKLPGGKLVKTFVAVVMLVGLTLIMFTIGFPAIGQFFNVDQTTITEQ